MVGGGYIVYNIALVWLYSSTSPGTYLLTARSLHSCPPRALLPVATGPHHLVPYRSQQTDVSPAPTPASRGKLDHAAEFVVTKLDEVVNWARKVSVCVWGGGGGGEGRGRRREGGGGSK